MSKIPVFVSCPTTLTEEQEKQRDVIINILTDLQLEARALGRGDYPMEYPLKEGFIIAKHCAGGIILGFEQVFVDSGMKKRNSPGATPIRADKPMLLPTPWNHLEAGILYGMKLPLLIFKEDGIEGGVFDYGITDAFINSMPKADSPKHKIDELKQVFLKWYALVSAKYQAY